MIATIGNKIAPQHLRLMLLDFGLSHPYQVVSLDEIARAMPHIDKEAIREGLDELLQENLVARFTGRYCFNKLIPLEDREGVQRAVTPSGTFVMREGV